MHPYSNADSMLHNLALLTVATWDPIWILVHLAPERMLSFHRGLNAEIELLILL